METTDKSLIEAHCQGDPTAFGEIVHRYGDGILGYLIRMTGNRLASFGSPLVFGPAVQYLGMAPAFGLGGLILLGSALLFFILRRNHKERDV